MKLEIKWVAIIFVLHILWHFGERATGFYGERVAYHELSGIGFFVIYALIMLFAISELKTKNKGFLNRRQGLLSGLFISLMLVALAPLMVLVLMMVIQPDFFNEMIMATTANGEYHAYEAAEQNYNYWSYVKLYMAGYLLVGSLSAALWSFLMHKMPEPVTD